MIQAVIFDMDGLLIDSEPLWKEAEIKVFNTVGVPLTDGLANQTTGLRTDEVVQHWYRQYPWSSPSQEDVHKQIDESVLQLIKRKGLAKEGVAEVIAVCERLNLTMAIASSSSTKIIMAVVEMLGIEHKLKAIQSAEFEPIGKPHPAVYLNAALKLGIEPQNCLAFEDSVNGVLSAKAAKMRCIAVPEPDQRQARHYGIADIVVSSLRDVTADMIQSL